VPIDPAAGWQPIRSSARSSPARSSPDPVLHGCRIVRRYLGALEAAGVTEKLAILIGVNPLRSAKSAAWMKSHCSAPSSRRDGRAAGAGRRPAPKGIRICVEIGRGIATIPGVAGVHIMAPDNDAAIPEVILEARARIT